MKYYFSIKIGKFMELEKEKIQAICTFMIKALFEIHVLQKNMFYI